MNSNYVTDIAVKITHSADISTAQAITEIAIIMKLVSRLSLASSHELSVAENAEATHCSSVCYPTCWKL